MQHKDYEMTTLTSKTMRISFHLIGTLMTGIPMGNMSESDTVRHARYIGMIGEINIRMKTRLMKEKIGTTTWII